MLDRKLTSAAGPATLTLLCCCVQPPAAGLTGWRRSATGKFSIASGVEDDSSAGSTPLVVIEQEDATTNAYVYQRALAVRAQRDAAEPGADSRLPVQLADCAASVHVGCPHSVLARRLRFQAAARGGCRKRHACHMQCSDGGCAACIKQLWCWQAPHVLTLVAAHACRQPTRCTRCA